VWLVFNTPELVAEHKQHSKLQLVPTVISPDGKAMQDSTPIIEALELLVPGPSIHPSGVAAKFISQLLEEFADEWGNKWMMHYRWYSSKSGVDVASYSRRVAVERKSGAHLDTEGLGEQITGLAQAFKGRMLDRGFTVGSNDRTAPIIEQSFLDSIILMDAHLAKRPFLFGRTPSLADFGLAGQLYQCFQDVTAGELMRLHAPNVASWSERMVNPTHVCGGGFETWETLAETLAPFLSSQVLMFLRWSDANSRALSAEAKELSVDFGDGKVWQQTVGGPQRYHAKSLREIRRKFAAVANDPVLHGVLSSSGCLEYLAESAASKL